MVGGSSFLDTFGCGLDHHNLMRVIAYFYHFKLLLLPGANLNQEAH